MSGTQDPTANVSYPCRGIRLVVLKVARFLRLAFLGGGCIGARIPWPEGLPAPIPKPVSFERYQRDGMRAMESYLADRRPFCGDVD